jgi:hypothetical protein
MLIDSNIIIYSARLEYPQIRQFIAEHNPSVSALSYVEVLGYHQLTEGDRLFSSSQELKGDRSLHSTAIALHYSR